MSHFKPVKSWIMKISALLILILLMIGCRANKEVFIQPEKIYPNEDNVTYIGKDVYSGYLYEYFHEKCPGTYWNSNEDRCIRLMTILSKEKLSDPFSFFKKGVLHIDDDMLIILDRPKWAYNISNYQFNGKKISDFFPDEDSFQDSKYYESKFFLNLTKNKDACTVTKKLRLRITECQLNDGVSGLQFSASNDLLSYTLSPYSGIANFGMPLELTGTSSNLLWVVPDSSAILKNLTY